MKAFRQILLLVVLGFSGFASAFAETLPVGIALALIEDYPEQYDKMKKALISTGFMFDFRVLPGERSLRMLSHGELAIDLSRQPSAAAQYNNLIQIKPSTSSIELWLMTHPDNTSLCPISPHQYKEFSVVGVRGFRLYSDFVYPHFSYHEEVNHMEQALRMIFDKRADFFIWGNGLGLYKAQQRIGKSVLICSNKPFVKINLYSYIHEKYSWAIPKIEKAYREYFK
mgnify:CR=1 FL=1